MGSRVFSFLILTAIAAGDLGCKKKLPGYDRQTDAGAASDGGDRTATENRTKKESADAALLAKLNVYIAPCVNAKQRNRMGESARLYSDAVESKKGPTLKGASRIVVLNVDDTFPKACGEAAAKAKEMTPALSEIETTIQDYLAAYVQAAPIVNEASKYYGDKNYKDDKLKKGAELHHKLLHAWTTTARAESAFLHAFETLKNDADRRELKRLETDGPRVTYVLRASVLKTKEAMARVDNASSLKDFFAVDHERLFAMAAETEKYAAELKKLENDGDPAAKKYSGLSRYTSALDAYAIETKEVARRIRDKQKFREQQLRWLGTSAGWMVSGSPDALAYSLKSVIESYNSL